MRERNVLLDVLKGFAILLVVLGHAVQHNLPDSFDDNVIFRVIYSFHMPLFMFVSGFVSYKTFDGTAAKLLKRFKSLIIPFWSWFLFSYFFYWFIAYTQGGGAPDFSVSVLKILASPYRGLWFLWVLFMNYLVLFVSMKISRKREDIAMLVMLIGFNIWMSGLNESYLGLAPLCWFLLFYLLGYMTSKYEWSNKKAFHVLGIVSLIAFPILVSHWARKNCIPLSELMNRELNIQHILDWLYGIIVPLTGIISTYTLFRWLLKTRFYFKNSLILLGNISLEIYSTHFYLFSLIFLLSSIPLSLRIPVTFIMVLTASILIQWLLKKVRMLAFIFYGKG